jgi:class 3 adenylate cyclase
LPERITCDMARMGCWQWHAIDVSDGRVASIDELLDRAVAAINRGDRVAASALADQVLTVDGGNAEAEDLLTAPGDAGEIRRLTILFADLVDSTVLSTRVEPETYRMLVGRYREQVIQVVDRFGGHVGSAKGDGLLAVFGHPTAHEDDVRRAVMAGLEITRQVVRLSAQAKRVTRRRCRDAHGRRPFQRRALGVEWRPVHHGIAGSAVPACVSTPPCPRRTTCPTRT